MYKNRYVFFAISLLLFLIAGVALAINGLALDIQFKGGTILKYSYQGEVDTALAQNAVDAASGRISNVQIQSNVAGGEQMLIINLAGDEAITTQEQEAITAALDESMPGREFSVAETRTVEPFIGARFFRNGLIAIALSFSLILIYVGFRFRKIGGLSAGTMAIIALVHDALMVTATFIVFKIPLNDSFIAAVLTIIGFSINDTIVVYDRIRENKRIMGDKWSYEELIDTSVTQSMTRSVNTSLAVLVSITIVYIFAQINGIESIRSFALPMMIGTVSGCYSTICIAGPLWAMWKNHRLKAREKQKMARA